MQPHTPTLIAPSLAHHRVSGPHDVIGPSIHQRELAGSFAVEECEVEERGKGPASASWFNRRFSVPWPTCHGVEDDLDNSHRVRTTDFAQPRPLSHPLAPAGLEQPTAIQSQSSHSHINSTQPAYHPVMVVASKEWEPNVERIRGGGPTCCGFTISGRQGRRKGIEIDPSNPKGSSRSPAPTDSQVEPTGTPMRETISRPMTPSQGASRSRAASHSSPKPGSGPPAGSRSRRPSQAQASDGAKQSSQQVPRSRTPSQAAEPRPRTQSAAKEPRSRAASISQQRSRANSRAGHPDSTRPRLHSHHLSSTAPTLPPVPSPLTPIKLDY